MEQYNTIIQRTFLKYLRMLFMSVLSFSVKSSTLVNYIKKMQEVIHIYHTHHTYVRNDTWEKKSR